MRSYYYKHKFKDEIPARRHKSKTRDLAIMTLLHHKSLREAKVESGNLFYFSDDLSLKAKV